MVAGSFLRNRRGEVSSRIREAMRRLGADAIAHDGANSSQIEWPPWLREFAPVPPNR
jgi:hypothetical protein